MAAILQVALERKVTAKELIAWVCKQNNNDISALQELECIRAEFVAFFLNYLRDHTAHLLQGCRSASTSPTKTPASIKANRKTAQAKTSTPANINPPKSNRVQLFAGSPLDSPLSVRRRGKPSPNPGTGQYLTFDSPFGSDASPLPGNYSKTSSLNESLEARLHRSGNASFDTSRGRASPSFSRNDTRQFRSLTQSLQSPAGQRTSPNDNQNSRQNRSNHRSSLGDFIVSPDPEKSSNCKTPRTGSRGDDVPLSPRGKRSGGKGKNCEPRRMKAIQFTESPSPCVAQPTEFSISNMDDFPTLGGKEQPKKPSRRITPTPISTQPSPAMTTAFKSVPESEPGVCAFSSAAFPTPAEQGSQNLEEERKQLKEKREKQKRLEETSVSVNGHTPSKSLTSASSDRTPSKGEESAFTMVTPTKLGGLRPSLERLISGGEPMYADTEAVTDCEHLDVLAKIYAACISELLVPNLTVELYFLVQLLTARGGDPGMIALESAICDENYLSSLHNVVYFAVTVIDLLKSVLTMLDKGTLRLLSENSRVREFSPTLQQTLSEAAERLKHQSAIFLPPSPIGGVSFQAETDNRTSFPNDKAFHHFKKQRDMFYELLREWEENRHCAGWSMTDNMADRIIFLVGGRLDLANHVHFARLFQSQLIQMCKGDQSVKSEREEENSSLLSELKIANPEKFKRLQDRFIAPSGGSGPCPSPSFPGCQEFFRDFISIAANHVFNQHLTNCMAARIAELNNIPFAVLEAEVEADKEDREVLSGCLTSLRLLGKFLGYVNFLPYQTPDVVPEGMHGDYIEMRNQCRLPLDLSSLVDTAVGAGRVVVTLPWVVEFLSQMDGLAPRVSHIRSLLGQLIQLYRLLCRQSDTCRSSLTWLMIVVMLGWLFESPMFPEELFFEELPLEEMLPRKLPAGCPDVQNLVDRQLLYASCPYLSELRGLLLGFITGSREKGSNIRKITPLSTVTEPSSSVSERQMQHQLEENFFHNHPASLKRAVDFVADRTASNHIKGFRCDHLPALLQRGKDAVMDILRESGTDGAPDKRAKKRMLYKVEDMALKLSSKSKKVATQDAQGYCATKAAEILALVLPSGTSEQVTAVACQITCRLALERVNTWVSMHLNKGMFEREMSSELEKQLRNVNCGKLVLDPSLASDADGNKSKCDTTSKPDDNSIISCIEHQESTISPSDLVISAKETLLALLGGEATTNPPLVQELLGKTRDLLLFRGDTLPGVPRILGKLLVDIVYAIVLYRPSWWTVELRDAFWSVMTGPYAKYASFDHTMCPKHVYMAQAGDDVEASWECFSELLCSLLRKRLLSWEHVMNGTVVTLQQNLLQATVMNLCGCVSDVARQLSSIGGHHDISELLETLREMQGCPTGNVAYTKALEDCVAALQMLQA